MGVQTVRTEYVEMYIYQAAKLGNEASGDVYYVHTEEDYCLFAIADGLGSGPAARQSAEVIPTVLKENHHESLDELLSRCNTYMIQKRGAVAGIVKIDYKQKTIQYSCVGNVRFYILQDGQKMIYPLPVMGYLSGKRQKLKTQEYAYRPGDIFFLHSDGIELRSAKTLLKENDCSYEVYRSAVQEVNENDDATFITGSLLR